jgi:putative transposase
VGYIVTRIRGYKYRAYPNREQREFFQKNFGCCRYVYNHYLSFREDAWKESGQSVTYSDTSRDLSSSLKKENPWLKEADSIALQQSLRHLDTAYSNFFQKRGGYPKFKSKRSVQSYRTMNVNGSIRIDHRAIRIPKAGRVKIRNSRDFDGRIISATISQAASGRYYITLQVEEDYVVLPNDGGVIGLDAGLKVLYTDCYARSVENPKTLAKHEKKLKRLQRSLSRKRRGSKNREKARRRLSIEHEKVANIRNDFQHKVTYRLANENQVVCVEDLNVKGMMKNHRMAKSIGDASWAEFYRKLEYKLEDRGGKLVKVPRTYPSSQLCFNCGSRNHTVRDLSIRTWRCPVCGEVLDRDTNAAINILEKGMEMLAS